MGVSVSIDGWNEGKSGWDIRVSASWANELGIDIGLSVEAYHGGWVFLRDSILASSVGESSNNGYVRLLGMPPYFKIVVSIDDGSTTTYNVPPHKNHYWDEYILSYRPKIQHQDFIYLPDGISKGTGCCVCNALTACREKIEYDIRGLTYARYSVGWLYGNVNRNITDENAGMYTADALNVMKSEGVPYFSRVEGGSVKTFPDVYLLNDMVSNGKTLIGAKSLYNLNKNNQFTQYGKIDSHEFKQITNVLSIMNNIKNSYQGVVMSLVISAEFDSAHQSMSGICERLSKTSTNRGSHVLMIIGWKKISDEYYWICHNSWGVDSGDGGLLYIPVSWCYNSATPVRGIIGYDIMYGGDYGSNKLEWDTPKTKSSQIENTLSAEEWNRIQKYTIDAWKWKWNSTITFANVSVGGKLSATNFNAVRTRVTGFFGLGGDVAIQSAVQNKPIKANEHLNAVRDSLNSIY